MTQLLGISAVVPPFVCTREDSFQAGKEWLKESPHELELYKKFVSSSLVETRYFISPWQEVISKKGLSQRAEFFEKWGPQLAVQAVKEVMAQCVITPNDISSVVFISCSLPTIPAIDLMVLHTLEFSPSVFRVPVYQYGCGGGVAGLALASRLCPHQGCVLVISVELCSLLFWNDDASPSQLVGASLFGYGASAALIGNNHSSRPYPFDIIRSQSHRIPNSFPLMGYTLEDNGPHLFLAREIPEVLKAYIPDLVDTFLKESGLTRKQVSQWFFHPGGAKILSFLEKEFLGGSFISSPSRSVFGKRGNMSSSTILHVLEQAVLEQSLSPDSYGLVLGIGPGLTLELVLLRGSAHN